MKLNQLVERGKRRLRREVAHRRGNRRFAALGRAVMAHQPPREVGARPVIFFNASTRLTGTSLNAAFSQLAAWSLRLAGTPVVHFACRAGMSRCVLGTNREDASQRPPCEGCVRQSQAVYGGAAVRWFTYQPESELEGCLDGLSLEQLTAFRYRDVPLGELVLPSLRWILRRHHLADDEPTRLLCRHYLISAWSVYRQFTALLDETDPLCVVVFNGQFFPEATARFAAHQRGLEVISHEVGLMPFTGYFTRGEATAYPIDIPVSFEMSPEQDARLDAYLEKRMQGNFSMAGVRFWPEMRPLSAEFWQRAAAFKQIVPVFTNVVFDTSQGHANVLYPHMFAWLDDVLAVIRAHPETLFVIRAHPDEARSGKESRESVASWVEQKHVRELPNVLFVDASEYFSSYELIQKSRFVIVYNSTIGLEASLMGAAVLCGGRARFTQLPTVFFPATAEEYRRMAEEFLTAETITVPAEFQRNARRFLYYQLFRTSLPFGSFVQEDGIWRGYVHLKPFEWQALLPQNSPTLRTVADGILRGGDFLLEE